MESSRHDEIIELIHLSEEAEKNYNMWRFFELFSFDLNAIHFCAIIEERKRHGNRNQQTV